MPLDYILSKVKRKQFSTLMKKYNGAKKELKAIADSHGYDVLDIDPRHAIYDSVKESVVFTDLYLRETEHAKGRKRKL